MRFDILEAISTTKMTSNGRRRRFRGTNTFPGGYGDEDGKTAVTARGARGGSGCRSFATVLAAQIVFARPDR